MLESNSTLHLFPLWDRHGHVNFLWKAEVGSFFTSQIWKKIKADQGNAGKRGSTQLQSIHLVNCWVFPHKLRMLSTTFRGKKNQTQIKTMMKLQWKYFDYLRKIGPSGWALSIHYLHGLHKFFRIALEYTMDLFPRASEIQPFWYSAGLHLLPLQYGRAAVIYVCNTRYHSPQFLIFHGKLSNKSEISHVNNYPIYLFSLPFLFLLTWQVYKPSLLDKSFPVLTTCLTNIYQLSWCLFY